MIEPANGQQLNISKQAVHGTLWAYLSFASGKLLVFITMLILVRIGLSPEEFGLMGYCLIAIQYLDVLTSFGLDSALISRRDKVEQAANAAFVISILLSATLFGLAWLAAPIIAAFFKEERVAELLRVLAVVLPIVGLGVVPNAMIQRSLRFKARLVPDIGRNLLKGICSVALAALGYGVWSLVWGHVIGEVAATVAFWLLGRWRPTFVFEREVTRQMLSFGQHIIVIGLVGALLSNIDYILVGRFLGKEALGFYSMAYRIPDLIIRNTNVVVAKVAHPLLSRLQSDNMQLRSVYFAYVRYIALFTFPVGVGLALVAPHFIQTFYPPVWQPSIPVMQLLSLAIALSSIGHVSGVLYKAINRPNILTRITIFRTPVIVAMLWYSTRGGIIGVALGWLVAAVVDVLVDYVVVSRVIKVQPAVMLKALAPAILSSTAMGVIAGVVALMIVPRGLFGLLLLVGVGISVYVGMLMFVSRDTVLRARRMLHSAFARS